MQIEGQQALAAINLHKRGEGMFADSEAELDDLRQQAKFERRQRSKNHRRDQYDPDYIEQPDTEVNNGEESE